MNAPFLFMAIWYGGFKGYFFESSYLARVPGCGKTFWRKTQTSTFNNHVQTFFRLNQFHFISVPSIREVLFLCKKKQSASTLIIIPSETT